MMFSSFCIASVFIFDKTVYLSNPSIRPSVKSVNQAQLLRKAAKKCNGLATKRGGGLRPGHYEKKSSLEARKKNVTIKLEGGRALGVGPLKKELFAAFLVNIKKYLHELKLTYHNNTS